MPCLTHQLRVLLFFWAGFLGFCPSGAFAGESPEIEISSREKWTTVFGDSTAKLRFDVTARKQFNGIFRWSYSANGRTIDAGERELEIAAGRSATAEIVFRIPSVKEGVSFPTQLSLSVTEQGQRDSIISTLRPITIFPRNPLFQRSQWAKELSISLFDPPGHTSEVFQSAGIPFNRIRNVETLDDLSDGLLIIGEGVSFRRHRALSDTLFDLAARGVPVLCLAPQDGEFTLPMESRSMVFQRHDIIKKLDKRLDFEQWMSTTDLAVSRITLQPDRSRIVGQVSDNARGWSWIELEYEDSMLVYCGFGIIKHWDSGPTPRYLLTRILEHLTRQGNLEIPEPMTRRKP